MGEEGDVGVSRDSGGDSGGDRGETVGHGGELLVFGGGGDLIYYIN